MKYEIITDNKDTIILVLNSRVIMVSNTMSDILDLIGVDHTNRKEKGHKAASEALKDKTDKEVKEIDPDIAPDPNKRVTSISDTTSLDKLFGM